MSHVVTIRTQVRDENAARSACRRLGLVPPVTEEVKLFSKTVSGLAVRLSGWRYPVVFNCASGEVQFDNYEGRWGERAELDRFLQVYAVEKTKLEARRAGHSVSEQKLESGAIKVRVQVGGVA